MTVLIYDTPRVSAEPPARTQRGKYASMYADMKPGQWYIVAEVTVEEAESASKKLMSINLSFRKLGAKVSVRTGNDRDGNRKAWLYVRKPDA